MHVYQIDENGWNVFDTVMRNQEIIGTALGIYCYSPLDPEKVYSDYDVEKQAEMVADRFLKINSSILSLEGCNSSTTLNELNDVIPF